jgi:hypothetical protein
MRDWMNFRRLPDLLIRSEAAFRINQVRREERVNQRRLSQTSLTCATKRRERQKPPDVYGSWFQRHLGGAHTNDNNVELETSFQELVLNLTRDGLETNVGVGTNLFRLSLGHFSR